uniref:Uncharacterized protein n=1 Tax=Laurencia verruciformis TaxID=3073068 RepID=A0AA51NF16_9FLOR|nr:hypothetical protein [Laurencia verruciformis]
MIYTVIHNKSTVFNIFYIIRIYKFKYPYIKLTNIDYT